MHTNVTTDRHVRIVSAYSLESWNRVCRANLKLPTHLKHAKAVSSFSYYVWSKKGEFWEDF